VGEIKGESEETGKVGGKKEAGGVGRWSGDRGSEEKEGE